MVTTAGSPEPSAATCAPSTPMARPSAARPLGPDLVRSEWTKLRTLRSTWWALVSAAAGMVGLGGLFCARYGIGGVHPAERAGFDPAAFSLSGFFLAQLAVGVLGALAITSEYATGSILATLAVTPQRWLVLGAKAVVLSAITAGVGIGSSFAAFMVGQAILAHKGLQARLGDPGVLRSVLGAGLYLAVPALLALGVGTLVRSTVGATAMVVGLVFVLPGIVAALPSSWEKRSPPTCPPTPARRSSGVPSSRPRVCTCSPRGSALPSCPPTRPPPSLPPPWSCPGGTHST
jgi:ABC-2 type transport system permease protein